MPDLHVIELLVPSGAARPTAYAELGKYELSAFRILADDDIDEPDAIEADAVRFEVAGRFENVGQGGDPVEGEWYALTDGDGPVEFAYAADQHRVVDTTKFRGIPFLRPVLRASDADDEQAQDRRIILYLRVAY